MSLSVKYIDVPIGAQEDAQTSATESQPFGSGLQIAFGAFDVPYATLEPLSWSLDGSRTLFNERPNNVGWWSKQRTESNGRFNKPPVISVAFSQPYTATGITFSFWPALNQWCNLIEVTWYNGQEILAHTEASPDSADWILKYAVESFDKIEIKILGTSVPGQFAKMQHIQIGQVVVFMQDELTRVSLLNEVDPGLCELSADTMTIEILEKKDRALLPQKNQEMYMIHNGVQVAAQYITESSRENQRRYIFKCQSAVGRLEDEFLGGVYNAYSIDLLLSAILEGFNADWESFAGQTITGYLPVCTRREALQQIAFAIGAAVTTQGDGTIRLIPLSDENETELTGSDIFPGAKLVREAQTATVKVCAHNYTKSDEIEKLLENENVNSNAVLYLFDSPHYDYEINGGTIENYGENWVQITASGEVTVTGKKYIHSVSVRKMENPYATAAEKGNVISVENATLINSENVDDALNRLYDFCALKNVLTEEIIVNGQKAGQKVNSHNPWGGITTGFITRMESDFTGSGHTANVEIRGKEVLA